MVLSVITDASARLYNALGGRAWFRTVTILLPNSWMDDANDDGRICGRDEVSAAWARGESSSTADIRVTSTPHPLFGDSSWARQSGGCGAPGDFIEVTHSRVTDRRDDLGALFVRDWAKYRYGVFDEAGIGGDPVFPLCYRGQDPTTSKVTGCSDLPIGTAGPCEKLTEYEHFFGNVSHLLHPNATSSIMFDPTAPQVTKFCNSSTHDRYAPTKHNLMCDRKSVMEVILQHPDFSNNLDLDFAGDYEGMSVETRPLFSYKREDLTRYILVVEDTKHMLVRESWTFLRTAVRKLAFHDLPSEGSVEVGLVGAMEGGATRLHPVSPLAGSETRDALASCLPYNPGDSTSHISTPSSSACLHCGIKEALDMLEERSRERGPAASVIIIVSAGMENESGLPSSRSLWTQVARANSIYVPLSTVNYPIIGSGRQPLDQLAAATGGLAFTVPEKRVSVSESHLSAYMSLSRAFVAIRDEFQRGGTNALPIEIHYRELHDEDIERGRQVSQGSVGSPAAGTTVITGSFVVEDSLVDTGNMGGWPRRDNPVSSRFVIFTYKPENPLVRRIELISPSNRVYRTRSDALSSIRALTLQASLNESGTWTYTIERFIGTPQPLYVQVTSTPKTKTSPVISARAWASSSVVRPGTSDPVVLYVEVKKGHWPVVNARVEVQVRMWPSNDSSPAHISQHHTYRENEQRRFLLLDTGSGDPDVTRGDGVYSRYFVPPIPAATTPSEQVLYIMDISVTDDGTSTTYTWLSVQNTLQTSTCCGSNLRPEALAPLPSFQRVLPPLSLSTMKRSPLMHGMPPPPIVEPPPSKIGDLRSEVLAAETRARLTWTAPGARGDFGTVDSYEVRFSRNLAIVADKFEAATPWEKGRPFPLAPGSDTSFTLDFVGETALLDVPLFFAIRATSSRDELPSLYGRPSNVVRVLVPSPPPPPPPPPPPVLLHPGGYIGNGSDSDLTDLVVVPQRAGLASGVGMALQVILPAAVGILLLVGVLGVYFFLVAQRRRRTAKKHQHKPSINTSTTTTTYTSANGNSRNGPMPTPPPAYEPRLTEEGVKSDNLVRWIGENDGSAKRFSLGDDMVNVTSTHPDPRGTRLSVICGKEVNGIPQEVTQRTLSPYQSWTASQLLHEHERRHSPYGYGTGPIMQQSNQNSSCGDESWMVGPPQQFSGSSQGQPSINGSTHNSIMGMSHNNRAPSNMGMVNGDGEIEGQWMHNHMNGDGPSHVHPRDQMGNVVEGSFLSLVDESNVTANGMPRSKVPPPVAPKPILHHGLGFNQSSHQGSLTSVRSSALDKKKRNVTQV
ncbi:hypothetical protein J437_LFUL012780 [Ladona fulva]|uniref:Calcium-activated chloride channel N-terminal domain-containing protein n=1 Tax=Ladona fulva TaxID=123851 RepID=A0A8K0KEU9_LADFU|nr:hypothetical protein J437_LFUL012780 [Ladona fulva]